MPVVRFRSASPGDGRLLEGLAIALAAWLAAGAARAELELVRQALGLLFST